MNTRILRNKVAVLQPSYLPWPGYFNQIIRVSNFVFLDDVQFDKNGWRNRNRILLNGNSLWLTVPVYQKNKFKQNLNNVIIDYKSNWISKHLNSIKHAYGKSSHFDEFFSLLESIILEKIEKLSELNIKIIIQICDYLGIEVKFFKTSELSVGSDRNSRLIEICKILECNTYLSGDSAVDYLDLVSFQENSINVEWQNFKPSSYLNEEVPASGYFSVIGLIFKYGRESLNYIK